MRDDAFEIAPLGEYVAIIPDPQELVSPLILIPGTAREKPRFGTVMAVGPGVTLPSGAFLPTRLQPGDRVCYSRIFGDEFRVNGSHVLIGREQDIHAVVEETISEKAMRNYMAMSDADKAVLREEIQRLASSNAATVKVVDGQLEIIRAEGEGMPPSPTAH